MMNKIILPIPSSKLYQAIFLRINEHIFNLPIRKAINQDELWIKLLTSTLSHIICQLSNAEML